MAQNKTQKNDGSVTHFLEGVDSETKRDDCFALVKLMEDVTGDKATMWGDKIVGFGGYTYTYASGRTGEWPIVGFSPRKQNLTLYIMSGFEKYDALLAKLGKHKTGKSCLYVKKLADVDQDVLRELVEQSVQHMRETNSPT